MSNAILIIRQKDFIHRKLRQSVRNLLVFTISLFAQMRINRLDAA